MVAEVFNPSVLALVAGALFTLGYLIINQVALRLVMMLGSFVYIAYYATAAAAPLWDAIYASIAMLAANVVGLCALYLRNASFAIPVAHADIFPHFSPARPGDFRALMRLGNRYTLQKEKGLTVENKPVDQLFFVLSGQLQVTKGDVTFAMRGPTFIGEVAYLLERGSAATIVAPAGSEIVSWNKAKLHRATLRRPRTKLALDAVISKDLARKVSYAVAPPASE